MATSGRRKSHDEDEGDERRKSKLLRSRRAHGDRYIRSGRHFDAIYMGDSDSKSSTIQSEPLMPSSHRKLRKKKKKKRPATHLERYIDRQSDREWFDDDEEEEEEFLTNRSTDDAEEESTAPPNRGVPKNEHCPNAAAAGGGDVFWDAAYRELQAELSSMRMASKELQEKLSRQEALVKNERRVNEELHNHQIDMQYDLAETRRVRNRLERENNILRKKLVKRDIEYTQLEEKLQALEKITNQQQEQHHQQQHQQGREPEESPEEDDEEEDDFHASKSLWELLAEEVVVSDQRERSLSPHKVRKPSIFDAFFSSSSATTTTTAHMLSKSYSMRGGSNNNNWRNPSPEHERSLPSGGFIPAA